ncbi:hypothetical protein [Gilvimarinus sp. 1_MG-2023]|uniref:hypothetical protein n=1 Tax=Gilvimarinus sp. 1_MG-2023 TaxID=3062638 RepID=UPI0026E18E30|nr:hypothetical protein [Gilvimarinus sp. 1_MG-2023]MDO6747699.1 hypothetical protein [Gilvimarinus sp. 1_MG-2023]
MTKETIAWLLVRSIGVFFLIAAAYFIYQFAVNVLFTISIDPKITVNADGIETIRMHNLDWSPFFTGAFFAIGSIYFLKFGSLMHKLLLANPNGNHT